MLTMNTTTGQYQKIRKYARIDVYMSGMPKHIFSKNLKSLQQLSSLEIIQLEALFWHIKFDIWKISPYPQVSGNL